MERKEERAKRECWEKQPCMPFAVTHLCLSSEKGREGREKRGKVGHKGKREEIRRPSGLSQSHFP